MAVGVSAHKNEAAATFAVRDVALHISQKVVREKWPIFEQKGNLSVLQA